MPTFLSNLPLFFIAAYAGTGRDRLKWYYYVDVLVGRKGKHKPHAHLGLNPDQTIRFVKPRRTLTSIRREVKQKGRLSDEVVEYPAEEGQKSGQVKFKILIDGRTRSITPLFEEIVMKEI